MSGWPEMSLAMTGWLATAVFASSYVFRRPLMLRRIQAGAALLWVICADGRGSSATPRGTEPMSPAQLGWGRPSSTSPWSARPAVPRGSQIRVSASPMPLDS